MVNLQESQREITHLVKDYISGLVRTGECMEEDTRPGRAAEATAGTKGSWSAAPGRYSVSPLC